MPALEEALHLLPAGAIALTLAGNVTRTVAEGDSVIHPVVCDLAWDSPPAIEEADGWVVHFIAAEESNSSSSSDSEHQVMAHDLAVVDGWTWRQLATSLFPGSRGMTVAERDAYRATRTRLFKPL